MKTIRHFFYLAFLIFLVGNRNADAVKILNGCPEHFARIGMHCSTIVMKLLPWDKASQECVNQGAMMFVIKDKTIFDQLLNSATAESGVSNVTDPDQAQAMAQEKAKAATGGAGMPAMPGGDLMMGLKFTKADGKWKWSDGTFYNPATDWAMWMSGSPPTPTKDACVSWKKKGKDVKWDVAECTKPGYTICYAQAVSTVQTCPDRYMQEQDMCIMPVMKLDSSYNSGSAECGQSGGTVAMLKKEEEYAKIKTLGGGMISQLPVPIWLGMKYTKAEGKWKWSDGAEYKEGDWGLWKDKKMPTPDGDMCVVMQKAGGDGLEWNTEVCDAAKGLVICIAKAKDDPTGESTKGSSGGGSKPSLPIAPSGGGGGASSGGGGGSSAGGGGGGGDSGGKSSAMKACMNVGIILELLSIAVIFKLVDSTLQY